MRLRKEKNDKPRRAGNAGSQFDARFSLPPVYADQPAAREDAGAMAERQARLMAENSARRPEMAWFEKQLREPDFGPGPAIGYYCQTVPPEIISAAGARPVRLDCGNPASARQGDEWISGEVCPLAKGAVAEIHDPLSVAGRCAALVLSTTCDAKRKMAEMLADYKPVFVLNLPPEQDARAYAVALGAEIARLAAFLERVGGTRIRRGDLLREIRLSNQRAALAGEIMEARSREPGSLCYRDALVIIQSLQAGADPDEWLAKAGAVSAALAGYRETRRRLRPRLVLTGAPVQWPNFKILNLVEECGADIVTDTLCGGFQSMVDRVEFDETGTASLFRALASRYVFSSPCPCFISQGTRLGRLLELVADHRADAVVHHGLRLCPLFDMEVPRTAAVLRGEGIPFLNLRTDYSPEDTEQLRVRLEAFLETVVE